MPHKPILIIPGQPKSIFYEIFFKSLKRKIKSPLILICDKKDCLINAKKFSYKEIIQEISIKDLSKKIYKNKVNVINVNLRILKNKNNQLQNDKDYIFRCFDISFKILKKKNYIQIY